MHQGISLMCHCEGALRPWQSRRTWWDDRVPPAKSQLPSRDCHVGLRPPRNDNPGAGAVGEGIRKLVTAHGAQGTPLQTPARRECRRAGTYVF